MPLSEDDIELIACALNLLRATVEDDDAKLTCHNIPMLKFEALEKIDALIARVEKM